MSDQKTWNLNNKDNLMRRTPEQYSRDRLGILSENYKQQIIFYIFFYKHQWKYKN